MKTKELKVAMVASHVDTVTSISNYLEGKGIKTVWTYFDNEAVALCQKHKISILVIGPSFSEQAVFDMVKMLSEQKIIIVTNSEEIHKRSLEYKNVVGLIRKPIDLVLLEKTIRRYA